MVSNTHIKTVINFFNDTGYENKSNQNGILFVSIDGDECYKNPKTFLSDFMEYSETKNNNSESKIQKKVR